jgi:hypothetical protein
MGVHSRSVATTPRLVRRESENLAALMNDASAVEQLRAAGEVRHKLRKSESSYDPELTEWLADAGVLAPSGAAAAVKAQAAEAPARAASLESGCVGQVEPEPACVAAVAAVAAPGCEAGAEGGAFSSWAGPRIALLHVPEPTSHEIFMSFVRVLPCGAVDGSGILSPECYQRWLETRAARPSHEAECFRKSLIAKVTRTDCGSAAFPPAVEAALLVLLRKRQVWPCFKGKLDPLTGRPIKIGSKGLRSLGFHEREQLEAKNAGQKASSDCCAAKRKAQCSPIAEEPSESDSDGEAPKRRRADA